MDRSPGDIECDHEGAYWSSPSASSGKRPISEQVPEDVCSLPPDRVDGRLLNLSNPNIFPPPFETTQTQHPIRRGGINTDATDLHSSDLPSSVPSVPSVVKAFAVVTSPDSPMTRSPDFLVLCG